MPAPRATAGSPGGGPAAPAAGDVASLDPEDLFARFESSPQGLSGEEAHRRLRRFGPNELPTPRPPHPLRLLFAQVIRVRRDGIEQRLKAREVVPGDVLIVHRGDRVAADARLVRAVDLRLDYSILTGESEPLERHAERAEAAAAPGGPPAGLPAAP